jgi:hypothetical protein
MKSVYREKIFYEIQHSENFLLIFFLVPHRAVPDLQRMKRPFFRRNFLLYLEAIANVLCSSFYPGAAWRRSNPESTARNLDCFAAQSAPLAMTE